MIRFVESFFNFLGLNSSVVESFFIFLTSRLSFDKFC